jgi:alpha-beta hydrolase superfamily lysophospholipase
MLLLESGFDTVVDPDGSEELWSAVRPGLLERHRLPGVYHEIFHDRLRAQAQALTEPWLERLYQSWNPSHRPAMSTVLSPEPA